MTEKKELAAEKIKSDKADEMSKSTQKNEVKTAVEEEAKAE